MSAKLKSVVSDRPSVMMNFEIVLDERVLDNLGDKSFSEEVERCALLDPEQAAELVDIDKEIQFRHAIESKMKAGGVNLEFVGKDQDGQDVYRVA